MKNWLFSTNISLYLENKTVQDTAIVTTEDEYELIVIDVVDCLSEVDKEHSSGNAAIKTSMPVVQHVDKHTSS